MGPSLIENESPPSVPSNHETPGSIGPLLAEILWPNRGVSSTPLLLAGPNLKNGDLGTSGPFFSKVGLYKGVRANKVKDKARRDLPNGTFTSPIGPAVREIVPKEKVPFVADPVIGIYDYACQWAADVEGFPTSPLLPGLGDINFPISGQFFPRSPDHRKLLLWP